MLVTAQLLLVFYITIESSYQTKFTAASHDVILDFVSEAISPRHRARREVDPGSMPDLLTLQFTFDDKPLILNLTKSKLIPVTTGDAQKTLHANMIPDDTAVYTDPSYLSKFIVQRTNNIYSVTGQFSVAEEAWRIFPVQEEMNVTKLHRVVQSQGPEGGLHFGNDAVYDSVERLELIYTPKYMSSKTTGHRFRRAVTQHVIEIAFIVDYTDYVRWVALYGENNALYKLRLWYTYIADGIKTRFESISDPDISITTAITILKVLTTASEDMFLANITDANGQICCTVLNVISLWVKQQSDIPLSDHYMLFTGRDITGASGLAIVGRVCTETGVSIVENSFNGNEAEAAAHELGHSLSSIHDSQTAGRCSDADEYIMNAVIPAVVDAAHQGNPWKFSQCSIDSFKSYLSSVSCTRPELTLAQNVLPAPVNGQKAGEVISRNDQCRLALQYPLSEYCQGFQASYGGDANICGGMLCKNMNSNSEILSCTWIRPLEYTPCGDNKGCIQGYCILLNVTTPAPQSTTLSTLAPTTAAPITTRPTTAAPITTRPTTAAPITTRPTTAAPITTRPTTAAPITTRPTAAAPTTTSAKAPGPKTFFDCFKDYINKPSPEFYKCLQEVQKSMLQRS